MCACAWGRFFFKTCFLNKNIKNKQKTKNNEQHNKQLEKENNQKTKNI